MKDFQVSVIIPVFNARRFIEIALNSALDQQEVGEVIVVDDGSEDESFEIAKRYSNLHEKISVYQHCDGKNHGRAATRNLGINKAVFEFISFLDADDFYLPERFKNDKRIFTSKAKVDGVYNAIGAKFYRVGLYEEMKTLELFSMKSKIMPNELFKALFFGGKGHFSIDGLTVKTAVVRGVGSFDEELEVMEDTHFIFKLALKGKLVSGSLISPVAIRGVHDLNVFNNQELYARNREMCYERLFYWTTRNQIDIDTIDEILKRLWQIRYKLDMNLLVHILYWCKLMKGNPSVFFSYLTIKYFPLVRKRKELFSRLYCYT